MITSRKIDLNDRESIDEALARDSFHPTTKSEAFYEAGVLSNIYTDEQGDVLVLRAQKALRIEMIFFDNAASLRNAKAMIEGWKQLLTTVKTAGFKEVVTSTNSPKLKEFAIRVLGFQETNYGDEVELKIGI